MRRQKVMNPMDAPYRNLIRLHTSPSAPGIYDVDAEGFAQLTMYDSVECHIVFYPYSRKISSEDIDLYPFQEYVKDVLSQQRSAYAEIESRFNEIFGLLLGLFIALAFACFKPEDLLSVESVVSVFGAYTIGKELWDDLEHLLTNLSKGWRIRYQDSYYRYQLAKYTTLTAYSYLAKQRRYGKSALLPAKIDLIKQSNSQTLRMSFDMKDLRATPGCSTHLHSIHIDPALQPELEDAGYLFGVKLSLNKEFLGFVRSFELFQSLDHGARGCLDATGTWVPGAVFYRNTLSWGRIKLYINQGLLRDETIIATNGCSVQAADSSTACTAQQER